MRTEARARVTSAGRDLYVWERQRKVFLIQSTSDPFVLVSCQRKSTSWRAAFTVSLIIYCNLGFPQKCRQKLQAKIDIDIDISFFGMDVTYIQI